MGVTNISVKSARDGRLASELGSRPADNEPSVITRLSTYLRSVASGQTDIQGSDIEVQVAGTRAFDTFTVGTLAATNGITLAGVAFAAVASGATGNQFNLTGSAAGDAKALAAAINASVTANVFGVLKATNAPGSADVTVECVFPGTVGNGITNAVLVGNVTGAANLAGGAVGTVVHVH